MNKDFKILVVDDTPELLEITVKALRNAEYKVFSANNGKECLDELRANKPDIVMLDVILPDVDGKELAKDIKSNPEFFSVYIILLSSIKISYEHISEGLEGGADGYIVRPVSNRELLARLESACRIISSEKKYKDALFKYQSLFSSMQEGVYLHEIIYDEQGKAIDYRILEANPASESHTNIKPEDAIGKLATELYQTPNAPFLDIYAEVTKTGRSTSFEQYFPPMRKHFHISVYSYENGKFATAFSDITERKEEEKRLNSKNLDLQKLNAEKDKFFSIIAHDLKSPFNSILGFSELLVESTVQNDCKRYEEYAKIIHDSSKRAMELLLNLMEWAQSQTGKMEFNPEYFEMNNMVNDIVSLLESAAGQKSIQINADLPPAFPVYADKAMVSTILRNLVANAIKFTSPGGKITLSVEKNQKGIMVSVKDTGVGISKSNVDKIFRLDENVSTLGTQNEKGTGLGLILCKEFVEKHGGKIWVESNVGVGSTFYFTLPKPHLLLYR